MTTKMTIWVNQKEQEYDAPLTLFNLLQQLQKVEKKGIAIAINNTVISKPLWEQVSLHDQDKVTIIKATQGG